MHDPFDDMTELQQAWPLPSAPRPVVVIGAGGIVDDAHLPAYKLAGFPVAGLFDIDVKRAENIGKKWDVPVFASLEDAMAIDGALFDLAIPPSAHIGVLERLPDNSAALLQKPMGRNLAEASKIVRLAKRKNLTAAVNFQLRFSPMMLAVSDALQRGWLGKLVDVEVHLNLLTPWDLFPFLKASDRVEIAVHSIHYLDMIRKLLGDPSGVHARTLGHPLSAMAQTRTTAILDYDHDQRVVLSINHDHGFGRRFQDATFRFEGTEGVAVVKLGLLLNYPAGEADEVWFCRKGAEWQQLALAGHWFPHAFMGTMSNLQRFVADEDKRLETRVEDAWHTMALVEAAYLSSTRPATPIQANP